METNSVRSMHPLAMAAGIAVILFSVVGISAVMGWVPTSFGNTGAGVVPDKRSSNAAKPSSPPKVAQNSVAKVKCADCGVVQSVRQVEQAGEGSGLGAAGGAVVGGLLGHQVGGGSGKQIMTVVGAVGGAVAGNEVEKRVKSTAGYETTVRFDDGTTRVFASSTSGWRPGDKVKVVNGALQSNT
jgi:outer membrane lipoprotein SlyB